MAACGCIKPATSSQYTQPILRTPQLIHGRRHPESCRSTLAERIKAQIEHRRKSKSKYICAFNFHFTRRMGKRSIRHLILSNSPFPSSTTDKLRISLSLNKTLGASSCNANRVTINGSPPFPCYCDAIRTAGFAKDHHFRHSHLMHLL